MTLPVSKLSQLKFRELCRQHTREALDKIVQLMKCGDRKVELAASVHILDRGFGKPIQTNELTGKDGESLFAGMSSAELKEELRKRLTDPETLRSLGIDADVVNFRSKTN